MISFGLYLTDLARWGEDLLVDSLSAPTPLTLAVVFIAGLITSLGPCSLSLLPVTVAYMAGFPGTTGPPWQRSITFVAGIVTALVSLGLVSALLGRLYGQVPGVIPIIVAVLAVVMGLNLLGLLRLSLPTGPDPDHWRRKVPAPLAPLAAGAAFGLAASPCTTPVLAVLLGWMAQQASPLIGLLFLTCFGVGQVVPLLLAGTAAASMQRLLAFRAFSRWVPPVSGVVLITTGTLTLLARWP